MSLLDEQKAGTIIRVPESELGVDPNDPVVIPEGESRLVLSQAVNESDTQERVYHIRCERDEFVIGMQLINPFHNYTTERLIIYDYRIVKDNDDLIQTFNVTRDIASFPAISSSYAVTLVFRPGVAALDRFSGRKRLRPDPEYAG